MPEPKNPQKKTGFWDWMTGGHTDTSKQGEMPMPMPTPMPTQGPGRSTEDQDLEDAFGAAHRRPPKP